MSVTANNPTYRHGHETDTEARIAWKRADRVVFFTLHVPTNAWHEFRITDQSDNWRREMDDESADEFVALALCNLLNRDFTVAADFEDGSAVVTFHRDEQNRVRIVFGDRESGIGVTITVSQMNGTLLNITPQGTYRISTFGDEPQWLLVTADKSKTQFTLRLTAHHNIAATVTAADYRLVARLMMR